MAKEIELNPEKVKSLLDSFKSTDESIILFLMTLKQLPPYMVPALIQTFSRKQEDNTVLTFLDVIKNDGFGTVFESLEDGQTYQFSAIDNYGDATVVKLGSGHQSYMDIKTKIRRKF